MMKHLDTVLEVEDSVQINIRRIMIGVYHRIDIEERTLPIIMIEDLMKEPMMIGIQVMIGVNHMKNPLADICALLLLYHLLQEHHLGIKSMNLHIQEDNRRVREKVMNGKIIIGVDYHL